jgi:hypothetical protein
MTNENYKVLLSEDAAKAFFRAKKSEGYEYAYHAEPRQGEEGETMIILSKHIIEEMNEMATEEVQLSEEIFKSMTENTVQVKSFFTEIDPIAECPDLSIKIYQIRGQD